jgi:hypothetical protein
MVAVGETVPRRPARYRATVNNDSESALCVRVNRHNALKSSGTTPNFRNTVASRKSPVAGSPVRLNATAPVWPSPFQRPCARSIAAVGFGHSIGSPITMLLSATSNGNATKYVIPAMAHLLNRNNPCGRSAPVQTCHAYSRERRRRGALGMERSRWLGWGDYPLEAGVANPQKVIFSVHCAKNDPDDERRAHGEDGVPRHFYEPKLPVSPHPVNMRR